MDGIVDLLNLMGAPVSMMEMENQRILKELRNSVNRRVNCEAATIGKTVSASGKQISDIRFLEEKGVLRTLPESLRKMAELRLQCPDTPLIFLTTPSAEILRERLIGRGTETPEKIRKRLANAAREAKSISAYDYLLINDSAERCAEDLHMIIRAEHEKAQLKETGRFGPDRDRASEIDAGTAHMRTDRNVDFIREITEEVQAFKAKEEN